MSVGPAIAQMAGISAEVIGQPIDQILISGNEDTQAKWILKWAGIQPGQILNIPLLKHAHQELRDTDLFRTVRFQAERFEDGELILHIRSRREGPGCWYRASIAMPTGTSNSGSGCGCTI